MFRCVKRLVNVLRTKQDCKRIPMWEEGYRALKFFGLEDELHICQLDGFAYYHSYKEEKPYIQVPNSYHLYDAVMTLQASSIHSGMPAIILIRLAILHEICHHLLSKAEEVMGYELDRSLPYDPVLTPLSQYVPFLINELHFRKEVEAAAYELSTKYVEEYLAYMAGY